MCLQFRISLNNNINNKKRENLNSTNVEKRELYKLFDSMAKNILTRRFYADYGKSNGWMEVRRQSLERERHSQL